jgi:hypothetical protein
MNDKNKPKSLTEAVDMLHDNMGLNDEIILSAMNEEDLIDVHVALGYHIEHEFGLLAGNAALLESCRIISGEKNLHMDDASRLIVKALWEKVRKANIVTDHE